MKYRGDSDPVMLLEEIIRNQRGQFCLINDAFPGEKQLAVGKKMRRWIGLKRVGLLDFPTAAGHMHLRLSHLDRRKPGGRVLENGIVGLAWLAGRQSIGHYRA